MAKKENPTKETIRSIYVTLHVSSSPLQVQLRPCVFMPDTISLAFGFWTTCSLVEIPVQCPGPLALSHFGLFSIIHPRDGSFFSYFFSCPVFVFVLFCLFLWDARYYEVYFGV